MAAAPCLEKASRSARPVAKLALARCLLAISVCATRAQLVHIAPLSSDRRAGHVIGTPLGKPTNGHSGAGGALLRTRADHVDGIRSPVLATGPDGTTHGTASPEQPSPASLVVDRTRIEVGDTVTVSGWTTVPAQSRPSPSTAAAPDRDDVADLFPPVGDVIAAYCPHDAPDDDYLDYREVSNASTRHVTFGPLVNMRCAYEFRYLRAANGSHSAVLSSPVVVFRQGSGQPTQGRISETGRAGEMNVMWVSDAAAPSLVAFRRRGDRDARTATGRSHTYGAADMCNHPANVTGALLFRDPGHIHSVLLRDLAPSTEYTYRFGSGSHSVMSPNYTFVTPPPVGTDAPMNFFVFGDLGEERSPTGPPTVDRAYTTIARIEDEIFNGSQRFDFVMHVGDISYAEGRGYEWEQFGQLIQRVATRLPYYVGVGNHDYDHVAGGDRDPSHAAGQGYHPTWGVYGDDSGGECAVPVVNRFSMPESSATGSGSKSRAPFWYSHSRGLVHMVWLSTEHDFYPGSEQHTFLVAELESVNRTLTPWVFVLGHRPMYCSRAVDEITAHDNYVVQLHQRQAYESVLRRYGVDVFFSGHYHAYERTCPVHNGTCRSAMSGVAEATVHVLLGTAGANQDFDRWDKHVWSEHRGIDYGYGRVHVANATHMRVEYVLNENASVADSAWIVSGHKWHL